VVVDASIAVRACLSETGFTELDGQELAAPPLLWLESASALHELRWRGEISADLARLALERLVSAPIAERRPRRLLQRAWAIGDELGWAKLYDAHYVALAVMTNTPLITVDARLLRSAARLVETIGPADL
jgi:predicted nucleic acid-binding protein